MMTQNSDKKREQIQMLCMDDLVPENHLLRMIDNAIDWTFIYDLVEDKNSNDSVSLWNPKHETDNKRNRGKCCLQMVFGTWNARSRTTLYHFRKKL